MVLNLPPDDEQEVARWRAGRRQWCGDGKTSRGSTCSKSSRQRGKTLSRNNGRGPRMGWRERLTLSDLIRQARWWQWDSHCNLNLRCVSPPRRPYFYQGCMYACMLSCVQLFVTPWMAVCQAPLSMGFFRQEYQSGFACPPSGDLPYTGIKPMSFISPASRQFRHH